jgi:hypothetical protein
MGIGFRDILYDEACTSLDVDVSCRDEDSCGPCPRDEGRKELGELFGGGGGGTEGGSGNASLRSLASISRNFR